MKYEVYKILVDPIQSDVIIALICHQFEIDGISYDADGFSFYAQQINNSEIVEILERLKKRFEIDYSHKALEDRNWNEVWESSFDPVEINQFCRIRAPFHSQLSTFKHDIVIYPGMAFGTGHHETTSMMVEVIRQLDLKGKKFLDAGCGTGVLAILAKLEQAEKVDAFDYDIHSIESIRQNQDLNHCQNIGIQHCKLQDFTGSEYDVIVANINRNVLVEGLPKLKSWLADLGTIIVSGYLVVDVDNIVKIASELGLTLISTRQKGDWVCQTFQ